MLSKQLKLYESDATKLIQDLKKQNPALEAHQFEGRARLWDKAPIDLDSTARANDSRVEQKPYVYQNL